VIAILGGALAMMVGVLPMSATLPATMAGAASTASTTTTTNSASSAIKTWRTKYGLHSIGVIADDVLLVVDTGIRDAKHPSKKSVNDALSHCRQLLTDSKQVPSQVPPIPSAAAQKTWLNLINSSIATSSACVTALQSGSSKAAKSFVRNLRKVELYERRLTRQLSA
jgi:hypothetical protein